MCLPPAAGTGTFFKHSTKVIRFAIHGCRNRPFFHIVVMARKDYHLNAPIEQLGSYDPLPNENNEQLVAFNFERIKYWLGEGARCSPPVAELLGLAGFYPITPSLYMKAWRNRRNTTKENAKSEQTENVAS